MNPGNIMLSKNISMFFFFSCSTCFWNCSTCCFSVVLSPDFPDADLSIAHTCTNHYLTKRFERCSLELLLYVKPLSLVFYPINSNHHFTDFYLFLLNLARPLVSVWVSLSKKNKQTFTSTMYDSINMLSSEQANL